MQFASFFSGRFITAIVVNPPEKRLAQRTSVHYSDVSIKNIDILPNRQYIANTADSAQERYS